jgi:hypothetical protein
MLFILYFTLNVPSLMPFPSSIPLPRFSHIVFHYSSPYTPATVRWVFSETERNSLLLICRCFECSFVNKNERTCDPMCFIFNLAKQKQTPWLQSAKRTIPTERPPLVGEVSAHFRGQRVSRDQRNKSPQPSISVF